MPQAAASKAPDAITLLKEEHREVEQLFDRYEKLAEGDAGDEEKEDLAGQICFALTLHTQIEERVLYPRAQEALGDDADLVDEANVEHASAKDLIAQLQSGSPSEPLYDAKVKVLGEYIKHHVKEEENEMFPKLRQAKELDLAALGEEMSALKESLLAKMAGSPAAAD
jgi:hemerythrin-like domain-containing protein